MTKIHRLEPYVQHYDWGGQKLIPDLLQIPPKKGVAYAEMWMGSHEKGQSTIKGQEFRKWLIDRSENESDQHLPYLFKLLDVTKMLSIQSHPDSASAEAGYHLENELGVPITAFDRVFRDANQKSEIMVALSDFYLLHGFRSTKAIQKTLEAKKSLSFLQPHLDQGIQSLFSYVAHLDQNKLDHAISHLKTELDPNTSKNHHDYWVVKAIDEFCPLPPYDMGIIVMYLMNLVALKRGESIYQDVNILHSYLEGQCVELMNNSDNVFRAGMTKKHISVENVVKNLNFNEIEPNILRPVLKNGWLQYPTTASDFCLSYFPRNANGLLYSTSPEIVLCVEGMAHIMYEDEVFDLHPGTIYFIESETQYYLNNDAGALIFRAAVPENNQNGIEPN